MALFSLSPAKKELISAMVTPLASIFGSGFLVIVPILAAAVGSFSVWAIAVICVIAYMVGSVIRFNIKTVEPLLQSGKAAKKTKLFESASDISLILAYVISVCLYLHILSAFVLTGLNISSWLVDDILTTTVIVFITVIGVTKGLKPLEFLEKWALIVTFAVIALLLVALATYDIQQLLSDSGLVMPVAENHSTWQVITILAGTLIVVQGFETSRYLGKTYSAEVRIKSSAMAQWIATVVYIAFVALALPVVHELNGVYNDNSLVLIVGAVATFLVFPLIIAATFSQFSASVADTLAASGNLEEVTRGKLSTKLGYLVVGVGAVILTWSANTYEVLALASRAFAFYYFLQCLVAITVTDKIIYRLFFILLAILLGFITIFAVPAG